MVLMASRKIFGALWIMQWAEQSYLNEIRYIYV